MVVGRAGDGLGAITDCRLFGLCRFLCEESDVAAALEAQAHGPVLEHLLLHRVDRGELRPYYALIDDLRDRFSSPWALRAADGAASG